MRTVLTIAAAVGLCLVEAPALAQAQQEPSSASPQRDASERLDEVIVTAARREEDIQKISLAIQVLSGEELRENGVVSHRDLVKLVPGGQFGTSNLGVQTYIRGVGSFGAPPTVPWNLDGVILDRPGGIHTNLFDLERIEVLKGPQGTLYGRNASGGAINLIANRPGREFGGYLTAEAGNYNLKSATGALNIPASETLAFRGAFQALDREGYLSDNTNDDERYATRVQALWSLSDDVSLYLSADYGRLRGRGLGVTLQPQQPGTDEWTGILDPANLAILQSATGGRQFPPITNLTQQVEAWGVSAELNWDMSFATLTVLPAYRWDNQLFRSNSMSLGVSGGDNKAHGRQTTVEARLSNSSDRLEWLVGAYYYDLPVEELVVQSVSALLPGFNPLTFRDLKTESYAVFGEATFSLTDTFRLIAGVRSTSEEQNNSSLSCDWIFTSRPCTPRSGKLKDDKVTWKGGLEFDVATESMAYLTVGTGFKAGGIGNLSNHGPESLTAYTLGSRNRFLNNTLQLNAEAFYWDYTDQQISATSFSATGAIGRFTFNAGKSEIYGMDLDLVYRVSSAGTLRAMVEYLHTELKTFQYEHPAILLSSLRTGCSVGPVHGPAGLQTATLDCSGFPLTRAPEWSGSLGYEHVFGLASGADITGGLTLAYASSRWLNLDYLPGLLQPDYLLGDADLTYNAPGERWLLTAYVRNIADEVVYNGALPVILNTDYTTFDVGAPRTYGVRVNFNF